MRLFHIPYASYSDEELMDLVVKSDQKAFDTLYERYAERMLHYFYRMLNRDEEKAQDFLQDLFIKVLQKNHLYQPGKKFSTWLYSIASNMVKNEYRALEVRKVMVKVEDMSALTIGELMDVGQIDRNHFKRVLENEVEQLSDKHKEVFLLRFKEELSIKEISEIMQCSEGTVKSRIFYALRKLAKNMKVFDPKRG